MRTASNLVHHITFIFLLSAALILGLAAAGKLVWPIKKTSEDDIDRVVRFVTKAQMTNLATALEISVAAAVTILMKKAPVVSLALVVWLAGAVWLYRIGLTLAPLGDGGCGCFGNPGGVLGRRLDTFAFVSLLYMFIAGVGLTAAHWAVGASREKASLA